MYFKFIGITLIMLLPVFCGISVYAQEQLYSPAKIIPASPTSASLGKFGNIPVSLFNGTPNIQVPLYEIQTSNHAVPILLNYDASGTKVRQDASWVGLGWSLVSGGAITRIVRQKDDLDQSRWGYYYAGALPLSTNNDYSGSGSYADQTYFNNVYDGVFDAEPDIFSYNFCGYSGRFVIGKLQDGSSVFLDEKNNMKIVYQNYGWIFTDGRGYKYYLSTKETAENYSKSSENEMTTFDGLLYLFSDGNGAIPSAWYLDSIVSPTTEVISFTYVKGKSISLINASEQFYKRISYVNVDCPGYTGSGASETRSYDYSRQDITDVYLKRIDFQNGSIECKLSERLDIEFFNLQGLIGPSRLDEIIIKDKSGKTIKSYSLFHSYFGAANPQGRLRLDSIVEFSPGGERHPAYKFNYFNPNDLPSKYSKSIDHWGYRNSASNSTILPSMIISGAAQSFVGGNREANEVNNYPIDGVLSKITYPTGGYTNFEFELHDYGNLPEEQSYIIKNNGAVAFTNPQHFPGDPYKIVEFTIPSLPGESQVPVTIRCTYKKTDPNQNNNDLPGIGYANLFLIDDNGDVIMPKYSCVTDQIDGMNEIVHEAFLNFSPGKYRIEMLSWDGWTYTMGVTWKEKEPVPLELKKGGGIRIKSITNLDNLGKKTVKKYLYRTDDGKSTGVLMSFPKYSNRFSVYGTNVQMQEGPPLPCSFIADYFAIMSSSIYPSGLSSKAGIVGYKKVTEIDGENGENGRTEYFYRCFPEMIDEFPGIPTITDALNGKPDSMLIFNGGGDLVKRTLYTYSVKDANSLKGVKLFSPQVVTTGNPLPGGKAYRIRYYDNYSYWVVPDTETEILYSADGNISTTKKFYYANNVHREPTQIDESRSDGALIISKFKRPNDYTTAETSSFAAHLRDIHVVSQVIEQQSFLKKGAVTTLLSGAFVNFNKYNNAFYKQGTVFSLESDIPHSSLTESSFTNSGIPVFHSSYKPAINYNFYDTYGNILEQQKTNDVKQSYIWGYNSQYPIASVTNAPVKDIFHTSFEEGDGNNNDSKTGKRSHTGTYSKSITGLTPGDYILSYWKKTGSNWEFIRSIETVSGSTFNINLNAHIDELRFYPKNAQMTTYTYDPLIGMTSQCDGNNKVTYYEYDSFGRLSLVRDQDKNIIKKICYNYAGQEESCLTYGNQEQTRYMLKDDCPDCQIPSGVTYTVPANSYFASSTTVANTLAQNEIDANGQAYANANGTCTASVMTNINGYNGISGKRFTLLLHNNCTGTNYYIYLDPGVSGVNLNPQIPTGNYNVTITPDGGSGPYSYSFASFYQYANTASFLGIDITTTKRYLAIQP